MCLAVHLLAVACDKPLNVATSPGQLAKLLHEHPVRHRPTLARLSLDLVHVPSAPALDPASPALRELLSVKRRSIDRLRDGRDAEELHARALWELFPVADETGLHRAAGFLARALMEEPDDPALLNDLGAIRFELALRGDSHGLVEALDVFQRAAVARPGLALARFNVALAASAIPLPQTARDAWASYRDTADLSSGWATEAEERLARVPELDLDANFEARVHQPPASAEDARRLLSDYPQRAGDYLLDSLLPGWAEDYLGGNHEGASRRLDAAEWVARAIAERYGDTLAAEVVVGARATPEALAEAFREIDVSLSQPLDEAAATLRLLAQSSSPGVRLLVARARNLLANMASDEGQHTLARGLFAEAESASSTDRHPKLRGRILWHRGRSLALQGRDAEALAVYHEAEAIFRRLDDLRRVAALKLLQSEELEALGRPQRAWQARLDAVATGASFPRYFHFHNALLDAAESLTDEGLVKAAALFLGEAVSAGRSAGDAITVAEAREKQVELLAASGELTAAREALATALHDAAAIDDMSFRQELTQRLLLVGARLATRTAAPPDAGDFTPLLRHFQEEGQHHRVIEVYWGRARRWSALGMPERAHADLDAALALLMSKNRELGDVNDRLAYSTVVHRVFAELVDLHAARGDALEALVYAECSRLAPYRAWLPHDLELGRDGPCRSLRPLLQERLGEPSREGSGRIYFSLEDRLLIWKVERGALGLVTRPISRLQLDEAVEAAAGAVESGDLARLREISRDLWTWLDLPAPGRGDDGLALVPDGILGRLPFAALLDPGGGRFLVESFRPSYRISFSLPDAVPRNRPPSAPGPSLLVADPAFDPRFTDLKRLAAARSEIAAIAEIVDRPRTLAGLAATRRSIADALGEVSLLHYAGHAVANAEDPFDSYLLLAAPGDPPEQQILRAGELLDLALPKLRLAVLSACETAHTGRRGATPATGLAGLATPFLLRGSVDVVATLRRVDDRATRDLMIRFHHHRRSDRPTSAALRAAQLELLRGENPVRRSPAHWAWVVAFEGLSSNRG